jgi:hypothetical protein
MNNPENTEGDIKNEQSREYRRGYKKWTNQRNWQQDKVKENKNTTQYEIYYGSLSVTLCEFPSRC